MTGRFLAAALVAVGTLATLGIGTVALLHGALAACLIPAICTFLALCLAGALRTSWGRGQTPRVARPYGWIVAATIVDLFR